jgi:hypothetical protein
MLAAWGLFLTGAALLGGAWITRSWEGAERRVAAAAGLAGWLAVVVGGYMLVMWP